MIKVTFMGAGSTMFAKNVLGDMMRTPSLRDVHIALYDIDSKRLKQSKLIINALNNDINNSRAKITAHLGTANRLKALKGANYVINAIQAGGYDPATITDFEVPRKYGLRQTIGDTIGIGGIFRGLRTIPVVLDFAKDIEKVCPDAWFLNYTNPMSILTGALLKTTHVKTVGLCHSVQICVPDLLKLLKIKTSVKELKWKIAGINHMAWLLEITRAGKDFYPVIKRKASKLNLEARKKNAKKHNDMVRLEIMRHFGYYITESSEHNAEYTPYWIKSQFPELIDEFNVPLDEYPRRCRQQIKDWDEQFKKLSTSKISHKRTLEYASYVIEAMETNKPRAINGNVENNGLITNLPSDAIVEVPCLVDCNGVHGTFVGKLPTQCAALNQTNINVHSMTIEAAVTHKKEAVYQAAMLDPHTSSELPLDKIRRLCDDMINASQGMLPKYK